MATASSRLVCDMCGLGARGARYILLIYAIAEYKGECKPTDNGHGHERVFEDLCIRPEERDQT